MTSSYFSFRCLVLPVVERCPVSDLSGPVHYFDVGTGVLVPWSVMGDSRDRVTVCPLCAEHSGPDLCDMCGSGVEVAGGICSACFESAPVGVWFGVRS